MKEKDVIRKIKEDFEGAEAHWGERMAAWSFVHNDLDGLTASVVQLIEQLRSENPKLDINEWAWPQIRDQFEFLSASDIADLFGHSPSANALEQLGFAELRPVVEHIAKGDPEPQSNLTNPPSVKKLEKNSLDDDSADFLTLGRRRVRLVEEYFAQHHDPTLGDKMATAFHTQYRMLVDTGLGPNEVLLELQRFAGWGQSETNSHNAAILAVITYYFDRCDIFEDPVQLIPVGEGVS